jgi:putative ABC transport system permease protein
VERPGRPMTWIERLARRLLVCHPPAVRARYGSEIARVIADRVRDVGTRSRLAAAGLLVRECGALVLAGLAAHRESRRPNPPHARKEQSAMDLLRHDLRHALRGFLRRPGFAAVAIGALALGIGANVAIFSVFHAVVLRPLPFDQPERLLSVWEQNPERDWYQQQVAPANFLDWRERSESFAGMAAWHDFLEEATILIDGEPTVLRATEVTGNFFTVLGVAPVLGPGFDETHTWAAGGRAAVLSHGLWTRLFGGDERVVGRDLELDGEPYRVAGVMPAGFDYPFRDAELWLNVGWDPAARQEVGFRRAHFVRVVGRLADGVTAAEAEAELAAIARRLEGEYPETNVAMGTGVTLLREWIVGDTRRPLRILMAAVGFVLLIACANVANMLLARANRRRHEMAVRYAIGGSRGRLVLQGLTEGLVLSGAGGLLGLALGAAAIGPFLDLAPDGLPRLGEVSVDGAVVLFSLGVALLTGLLFGLLPAWRGASVHPAESGSSGSPGPRAARTSRLLVVAEVALALPLLIGAGLVVRSLWNASHVEPGFDAGGVLVARVAPPTTRYQDPERVTALYREVLEAARGLPGVESAALSSRLPFGEQRWSSDFTADGWPAERYGIGVRHDEVSPGLFRTLGVPLLEGRDFDQRDRLEAPGTVIVNRALAERYFPGESPIGRRIAFDRVASEDSYWRTVVGVVGNVRRESLTLDEEPSVYAPVFQDPAGAVYLQARARSGGDPAALLESLRARVREIDPALPLFDVTTLEETTASSLARERFLLTLLTTFAGVALLLTAIGVFGVTHYATTRRVREIGVRLAVGAQLRSVTGMVLRHGLAPVLAGIAIGLGLSALLVRAAAGYLFEVGALDPATYAAAAAALLLAGLVACLPPARWARRVDVVSALRSE